MGFVRVYAIHTQARRRLFDWVRPLSQEQYTRTFPFGLRSLRGRSWKSLAWSCFSPRACFPKPSGGPTANETMPFRRVE